MPEGNQTNGDLETMISEKEEAEKTEKIESLQVLRAIAFLGIFSSHCGITSLGTWGASVFFILSGFLMTYRYFDRQLSISPFSAVRFSLGKIGKLYELHIITMLADLMIPVFFLGKSLSHEVSANAKVLLENIFLVQAWDGKEYFSMNAVAWFLSCCVFMYFVFPYIIRLVRKCRSVGMAMISMIAVYIIQIIISNWAKTWNVPSSISDNFVKWLCYICPAFRLGDFVIGALLGTIYIQVQKKEKKEIALQKKKSDAREKLFCTTPEILAIILFVFTQLIYTREITMPVNWINYYSCLFIPSSVFLIWVFSRQRGAITKALNNKALVSLGGISAYAYLIHQVVIHYSEHTYMSLFDTKIPVFVKIQVSIIFTILLSKKYSESRTIKESL